MPTPTKGSRLGGSPAHQKLILSNLATSLFEHGAITTTHTKAKRLQPLAENLISKAKRGDLNSRRQVMKRIRNKTVVHVLFTEIGERFAERPGGYTRIIKLGPRKGDNAPMVRIELVESLADAKAAEAAAAKPAKKAAAKKTAAKKSDDKSEAAEAVEAAEAEAAATNAAADKYGDDATDPLEDGSAPEGFDIKGNADSNKYHTPDGQWYEQTKAEVWFRTEEAAKAAGFTKAGASSDDK